MPKAVLPTFSHWSNGFSKEKKFYETLAYLKEASKKSLAHSDFTLGKLDTFFKEKEKIINEFIKLTFTKNISLKDENRLFENAKNCLMQLKNTFEQFKASNPASKDPKVIARLEKKLAIREKYLWQSKINLLWNRALEEEKKFELMQKCIEAKQKSLFFKTQPYFLLNAHSESDLQKHNQVILNNLNTSLTLAKIHSSPEEIEEIKNKLEEQNIKWHSMHSGKRLAEVANEERPYKKRRVS